MGLNNFSKVVKLINLKSQRTVCVNIAVKPWVRANSYFFGTNCVKVFKAGTPLPFNDIARDPYDL